MEVRRNEKSFVRVAPSVAPDRARPMAPRRPVVRRPPGGRRLPGGAGIPRRDFGHYSLLPDLTRCRPSPRARLSRALSTTAAPPRPRPSAGIAPIPAPALARTKTGNGHRRFPRSLSPGQRARHPALPLRPRHGYAAVLRRGLPSQASKTRTGVSRPGRGGYAPPPSPYPPDLSWFCMKRCNSTGSSRIPSRLAHRARPVRQYQADATSSRLLPPSPATPGSGCLQLHPAAATTGRRGSPTPIRT